MRKKTGTVEEPRADGALQRGVVAVIDALGFREARKQHGAKQLIDAVAGVRDLAKLAGQSLAALGPKVTVAAFSDSIIVAMLPGPEDTLDDVLVGLAGNVSSLLLHASVGGAPLAYRGCVAVGEVSVSDDVFVGEAIDEAAEWSEQAEAGVVWLTPGASKELLGKPYFVNFVEWPVPLKGRGTMDTLVVNPFVAIALARLDSEVEESHLNEAASGMLAPFLRSRRVDVVQKYQNTKRFLEQAKKQTLDQFPSWQGVVRDAVGPDVAKALADRFGLEIDR